jgi:phage terminase large subunit-like protein
MLSDAKLKAQLELLETRKAYRDANKILFFKPYKKQKEFFAWGATKRERLLMAGNQLGKTEAGAFETACHLTGTYPDWWEGRRWVKPVRGWAAGVSSMSVRDTQQLKLCGPPGIASSLGTGYIPRDKFADTPTLARGISAAFDTIQVKHVSGGVSVLKFKSYEQGREKFQAETLDFIWPDEEPPADVYGECLARIAATGGMIFITFTPLKGRSDVVLRFLDSSSKDREVVIMTIMDAEHISPEMRQRIIDGYDPSEREARVMGVPMMGEGRIFTTLEDTIREPIIDRLPLYWTKLWGVDFGINHPFAAVLTAWDRDNDIVHLVHTIRMKDGLPLNHAAAMKNIGADIPVAWPHDGHNRDKGSGEALASLYKACGLKMLPGHAQFADGSISTEAGIREMQQRMANGQLKVAQHLSEWFDEYRFYHRKDGLIVKEKDDLLSATRVALMAKRSGQPVHLGSKRAKPRKDAVADGLDFDLF